jgi:phosphoribosylformimino-5-aminoimidazole carboxamide ribotide isomerase
MFCYTRQSFSLFLPSLFMILLPAIDIKDGKCVRLRQGLADDVTQYHDDPVTVAEGFRQAGAEWLHLVDLDGAFSGQPKILKLLPALASTGLKIELGGGMRDKERVQAALEAGATRVVVGTRGIEDPEFILSLPEAYRPRIVLGMDAKDGFLAVRGWVEKTREPVIAFAQRAVALGWQRIIYTDISTDGMLTGPNLPAMQALLEAVGVPVIASGGVGTLDDILALKTLASRFPHLEGVIVGKAIYENKFTVAEAVQALARL